MMVVLATGQAWPSLLSCHVTATHSIACLSTLLSPFLLWCCLQLCWSMILVCAPERQPRRHDPMDLAGTQFTRRSIPLCTSGKEKVMQTHLAGPEVCTSLGSLRSAFVQPFPFLRFRVYASTRLCASSASYSFHRTPVINYPVTLPIGVHQGVDSVAAVQWHLCAWIEQESWELQTCLRRSRASS